MVGTGAGVGIDTRPAGFSVGTLNWGVGAVTTVGAVFVGKLTVGVGKACGAGYPTGRKKTQKIKCSGGRKTRVPMGPIIWTQLSPKSIE